MRSEPEGCQLSDYYRSGIDIKLALRFLNALDAEQYELPGVKPWRLLELRKNLWSLGFLEARDEPRVYTISYRGDSLLVLHRLAQRRLCRPAISEMMCRYVFLKAVTDVDWECFARFLEYRFRKKMKPSQIHEELFPEDSPANFSHRFGLHESIALQTYASELIERRKLDPKELDPYTANFPAPDFLGIDVSQPSTRQTQMALEKSLELFKRGILSRGPLSSTEALKSCVGALLLLKRRFLVDSALSSILLDMLIHRGFSVYQNPGYLRLDGRGLYRDERFYTLFSA